jgi:hypothetical protein
MRTINLDIPTDAAERVRRQDMAVRDRIVEVLRKYNVTLPDAPLDALADAMDRLIKNRTK